MRHLIFFFLSCFLLKTAAASTGTPPQTAVGWSGVGGDLSGIPQQDINIWSGIASWDAVGDAGWPYANAQFMAYIAAHPNGVCNFATALIPNGLPSAQWNGMLDEVVAGDHDSMFVKQGQQMAKYGSQIVYCRPWWEVTNSVTNLSAAKFIAAWNHAIPIIRSSFVAAAPTKTFKIVYCYLPDAQGDPKAYYPGPQNVDVIDADIYGKVWGTTTPTQTAMLAVVQKELDYLTAFATAENKGIGISEWGNFGIQTQGKYSNQGRGDDPEYVDLMLNYGFQHQFLYMIYFNIANEGVGQTFATMPLSLAHFRAALTSRATTTTTTTFAPPTTSSPQSITTFSGWQTNYFSPAQLADPTVSGPSADPYGSGVPNLLAYAFQFDPSTVEPSDLPQPTPKNGHLTMSYQVPSVLTDIDFIPEVSSDLQTWNSGSDAVEVVSNTVGPNGTTVTVEDRLPSTASKRYMRLRVTQLQ